MLFRSRIKLLLAASILALAATPAMLADAWNKKTILTVNETISIPGATLPPGKYVMKLLDSPSNRHVVQVFNEDETKVITTILAIPNYRLQPSGKTRFGYWETPAGQPRAMRSWFYPGDNFGQEFAYPKETALVIAQTTHETVPMIESTDLKTAEVTRMDDQGKQAQIQIDEEIAAAQPAPQPETQAVVESPAPTVVEEERVEIAQNTPPPAPPAPEVVQESRPVEPPATLPATGSPLPLIALSGLFSLGAAGALRLRRR